jgi:pyrroloquinoline-quinone synthase
MQPLSLPVLETFHQVTKNHPLWNHELLIKCRSSQLTQDEVKIMAIQMYKFCKEFSRILATIFSHCPDVSVQLTILENLYDEMGEGNARSTHPELFRHFTRALDIDDRTLEATPAAPETVNMIQTYMNLASEYGYLAALGAVCFASEGIVNSLYTQIQKGIIGAATLPREALIFFDLHIDLDCDHARKMAELIEPRLSTAEEAIDIHRAILDAMDARVEFFNGILRQMSQLPSSPELGLLMNATDSSRDRVYV